MSEIDVVKDLERLTIVCTTRLAAPPERVWQIWADPRQLERWWGPPTHPATFVDHDLTPGSTVTYFMTGPDGAKYHGWWRITAATEPTRLEFEDGFADDSGAPDPQLPTTLCTVTLEPGDPAPGGSTTTMQLTSRYPNTEAMEQVLAMGVLEGIRQALGQIPAVLSR